MFAVCATTARGSCVEFGKIVAFFVIVLDPLGLIPVVAALSAREGIGRLILRITLSATVLLLLFTVFGTWVLGLMGVTLNDMRVGGGLLLLAFALKLLLQGALAVSGESYPSTVVPLISPLLVGPGAITAAMVLAAVHGVFITVLAGVVAMAICYVVLLASGLIRAVIGDAGADLASRVMGVLIAAIAISYIRIGIGGFLGVAGPTR